MKLKLMYAALCCTFVAMFMVILGFYAHADASEAPSKTVLRIVGNIQENQKAITVNREAHIAFMSAKNDNEYQVRRLRELCYELDWSTLQVSKIDGCTPEDLL